MRDYVQKAATGLPLDPKKLYKLQLAVDEIATNIVLYSGLSGDDAGMLMRAEVSGQSLVVTLKDQGVPFDPRHKLEIEQAAVNKPASERRIGGLGIYLAITGVDKFSYEYRYGFNINKFKIYLNK
jgi:anti-sigma regulatory factor (Ser/Thr protein kinase)